MLFTLVSPGFQQCNSDECIVSSEKSFESVSKQNERCRVLALSGFADDPRHRPVNGNGAGGGDPLAFKSAREVAAWSGPVPRQHSTGIGLTH